MKNGNPAEQGVSGKSRNIFEFVGNDGICDVSRSSRYLKRNKISNQRPQVAGMFAHYSFPGMLQHQVVNQVNTRFHRIGQTTAAYDVFNRVDLNAFLHQYVNDDPLAKIKLPGDGTVF